MSVLSPLSGLALRAARAFLPAFAQADLACRPSRRERLGLILSAVDRCGADCPTCVIWALEQYGFRASCDAEPIERRLPC
jgi:hypothetical protein